MSLTIFQMEDLYNAAVNAKVGDTIQCPCCGHKMKKKSYQHKFFNTRHKDKYWNSVDDTRRDRAKAMRHRPKFKSY